MLKSRELLGCKAFVEDTSYGEFERKENFNVNTKLSFISEGEIQFAVSQEVKKVMYGN